MALLHLRPDCSVTGPSARPNMAGRPFCANERSRLANACKAAKNFFVVFRFVA